MSYVLDGDTVVFRTDPGLKLRAAPMRPAAFEIDEVDEAAGTGWSVLVQGFAYEITGALDPRSERLRTLPVATLAPGDRGYWIKVVAETITGRRIRRAGRAEGNRGHRRGHRDLRAPSSGPVRS